jgi:hypothetical protein
MRVIMAMGAAFLALAACDAPKPAEPVDAAEAPLGDIGLPVASERPCDDVAKLAAAFNEPVPFASLRTGNLKLGDRELTDKFTTSVAPAGASCEMGTMEGFSPNPGTMHVVNCQLFSSGLLDREANAEKAKVIFDAARAELDRCLPEGWVPRSSHQVVDANENEAVIYETRADAQRAMTASYYVYPIELRKELSDGDMPGQMPGWRVVLNFQKEIGGAGIPAQ